MHRKLLTLPIFNNLPRIFLQLNKLAWVVLLRAAFAFAFAFAVAAATATVQTLPGCDDHCSNISIPYPFGTTERCYIEQHFRVICNHTHYDPPKLFLERSESNIQITDILLSGELSISFFIAHDCYNNPFIRLPEFPISYTRNKFTAVGCDSIAVIEGLEGNNSAGGLSLCDSINNVTNGSCSGFGCCQTFIPKGIKGLNIRVSSFKRHINVWDFNPCSYAFIAEESAYSFSSSDLKDFRGRTNVPVVLDWAVGNQPCEQARKNLSTYACKDKDSDCEDFHNGPGYRCKCSKGYEGNPYLPNGCTVIDECALSNPCNGTCINVPGGFTCPCPKGYYGDGLRNGTGCLMSQTSGSTRLIVILGLCSGIGALILTISSWWLYKVLKKRNNKKRKEKFFKRNGGLLLKEQLSSSDGSVEKIKLFSSKELEKATDHYNGAHILGQGTIFKGMLSDGRLVAVKKSMIVDEGNVGQFINEVAILSQMNNHRNVVKLLGCCLETEAPLVVYEYISNATLFQHIHDPTEDFPLLWEMRLRIATEVAGALSYLHYVASMPIYHRDIK